ncbi:MAG: hypothetical protein V4502_12175 [Pseudomonadota bacterium]
MINEYKSPKPTPCPPARRIRHDGWTADRQEAFLKAYAGCGIIVRACRAVGMSRQSLRDLCAHPAAIAFRKAFDAARDCAFTLVEDGAVERSIHGVRRPVFYHGELVGEYREFDERLTMFLLRYRRHHRYGAQLDHLPPPPPPLLPPGCEFDEPDEDEAMGRLDFYLGDLTDLVVESDLAEDFSPSESIDKFDNFVGFPAEEIPGDAWSIEKRAPTAGGNPEDADEDGPEDLGNTDLGNTDHQV